MKVVMLGNTNVGKTTYMASLYGLMQQRVESFSLKAVNSSDHARLLDLAGTIAAGRYPFSTDYREDYNFDLQYQGKDVLRFCWADYRGGAIRETQNSEQASALIRDLCQADGIMMFCDGDALVRGDTRASEIRRMTVLVTQALQSATHPISLSIILTKTDRVSQFHPQQLSCFSGLFSVINASEWVLGALIPIACGVQPLNVPMPLLFALYAAVVVQANSFAELCQKHYDKALDWQQKSQGFSGFCRWVGDKWNGQITDEEQAQSEFQSAAQKYQEFEAIKEPVGSLEKYIKQLPIIHAEKELQDYAAACNALRFYQLSSRTNAYRDSWF